MVIEQIRDWVVIVTGIIWAIVYFGILVTVLVVGFLATKYLNKVHSLMRTRVNPMMTAVQAQAERVRVRTANLPGQPRPVGEEAPALPPGTSLASLIPSLPNLPFLHRRKPWYKRMLNL